MVAINRPREDFPNFVFDPLMVTDDVKCGKIQALLDVYRLIMSNMKAISTFPKPPTVEESFWAGWLSGNLEANRRNLEEVFEAVKALCSEFPNSYKEVTIPAPGGIQ